MSLTPAERIALEQRLRHLRPKRGGRPLMAVLILAALPLAFAVASALSIGVAYAALAEELDAGIASIESLEERETFESIRLYDRNGVLLREMFTEGRRTQIDVGTTPLALRQATIAVEDASFYQNPGFDTLATMRAALQLVLYQEKVSGGSTITQQLTRHVAFSDAERLGRSFNRKAKELVLAAIMARRYEKDQILEWYLNEIYYGNLAYGVQAASQVIFGKDATDLNLAESALLAGLPQAPSTYNPLSPDPDVQALVEDRQRTVLRLMVQNGFITEAESRAAAAERLTFQDPNEDVFIAPHFVVYIEEVLEEQLGAERMARGGLEVTTTLDLSVQTTAEQIVRKHVERLAESNDLTNSAVVVLEPRTGQVLGMVGSKDYWDDSIDGRVNVALRLRQPGSSIKPITFVTALEQGIPSSAMLWDVPMERLTPIGLYEPRNYDEIFHGPVRLRDALANSYNIPALKLLERVGVRNMIETANRMGISALDPNSDRYGLSLTLGGGEVTLMEMATAFSTFANEGLLVEPNPILEIRNSAGDTLYRLSDEKPELDAAPRAVSEASAHIISSFLSDNQARIPAFRANNPLDVGVPAAAKTGTTDDFRDNWTVGFTPYVTVAVWAGNSDNRPMRDSTGVTGAAPIWREVVRSMVFDDRHRDTVFAARRDLGYEVSESFSRPSNIVEKAVCRLSSLKDLSADCTQFQQELFVDGAVPEGDVWIKAPAVVLPQPAAPPSAEGEAPAPAYRLCQPTDFAGMDKAQTLAVLPLPEDERERLKVIEWASGSGWSALAPWEPCTAAMAAAALEPGTVGEAGVLGFSGSDDLPAEYSLGIGAGAVVTQTITLTGTVLYSPSEIEYYKVELGAGETPSQWITLGTTHRDFVTNGPIEVLDATALAPGPYVVRLVLVKRDGNFLRPPYDVPITIGR